MAQSGHKPLLGYFKLRGWAGPIRLLLAYLEVDHVEKLYEVPTPSEGMGEWTKEKGILGFSFPNMPYWIDSIVKLTETKAILKHISRTHNPKLLGDEDIELKARLEMLEEVLWDMWIALTKIAMNFNDDSKQDFFLEAKQKVKRLEEFLGKNKWTGGNQMTYVDFLLYEVLQSYSTFCDGHLLQSFPPLQDYIERFENVKQIRSYLDSKFIKSPTFSYKFMAKL